jgi:colicin import membrane protein
MFQSQVERCWKKPYGGIESQNPEAAFEIKLKRDGTLEAAPLPEGTPATPYLRVYQESALRAIIECQPYNLPAAYFEEWKYFAPVFTERKT